MTTDCKLLFIYDHKYPHNWMDGLWAALNILEEEGFVITRRNLNGSLQLLSTENDYDFILGWGAFNSNVDATLQGIKGRAKKGLCIAGNAHPPRGALNYNILFYETKWYRPQITFHPNIVHAFGVNTDIFFPADIVVPIVWDYIGVGAFALWKRWDRMKELKGYRMVVGEYQENNESESLAIVQDLVKNNVMVSNMVNPYDLANMYRWSRTLYMPSDIYGGGERAVWEAKACGIEVMIEDDNEKLDELLNTEVKDHHWYAKQLKEGILSCL